MLIRRILFPHLLDLFSCGMSRAGCELPKIHYTLFWTKATRTPSRKPTRALKQRGTVAVAQFFSLHYTAPSVICSRL